MEKKIHIAFTENKLETYIKTPLVRGDENAYKLIMNLEKYPDAKYVFIYAERADGETVYDSFEVFGEKAEYILKQSIYMCVGNMTLRIVLKDSGKTSLTASLLKFNVIDGAYSLNMAEDMGNLEDLMLVAEKKADRAETLSGYGIKDAYTKTEVDNKFGGVYRYCGSATVTSAGMITAQPTKIGDVYNIATGGTISGGVNLSIPFEIPYPEGSLFYMKTANVEDNNTLAVVAADPDNYVYIGQKGTGYQGRQATIRITKVDYASDYGLKLYFEYIEPPADGVLDSENWEITAVEYQFDVKSGDNVVWNGKIWDILAGTVDTSEFATKEDVGNIETALDNIITVQNSLIGGDGV